MHLSSTIIDMSIDILFDVWNKQKKIIDKQYQEIFFKERDVFFISMWKNVRFEQNGKWNDFARPVVIIKKFNNDIFWWVALSTKQKEWIYYDAFECNWVRQCAIISQIRLYDKNRLIRKIGMINEQDFFTLKEKIKSLL